jgi:hypothetical protein
MATKDQHRWCRIHKFLSVCEACGTLRHGFYIEKRLQFGYVTPCNHWRPKGYHVRHRPPCTERWPDYWAQEHRAAIEAAKRRKTP